MTFETALINSGYYYQPECGAYWKEDKRDNVHTYLELNDGEWSYVKYNQNEDIIVTKVFTLKTQTK